MNESFVLALTFITLTMCHCSIPSTNTTDDYDATIHLSLPPMLNNTSSEIDDALKFSAIIIGIIEEYLLQKLPPTAKPYGDAILAEAQEGLDYCETSLRRNAQIWQYKVCSSAQLRYALAALSTLKLEYAAFAVSATAGAARLKLLWFRL